MPRTAESGTTRRPRTLAEKLQRLRELKAPRGEQPPSYEVTARQVSAATGVSISGPYVWELVTGRTTNPKLHHLQALAKFFSVPVSYLIDEDADFEQLDSELELLHALKRGGVRDIRFQGVEGLSADLQTIQALLARLQLLDAFGDEDVRETAVRVKALSPEERYVLDQAIGDSALLDALQEDAVRSAALRVRALSPAQREVAVKLLAVPRVLEALEDEGVRRLAEEAASLDNDRLATVAQAVGQPELLDALGSETVREIARQTSCLSQASQQAVLTMIERLHQVERNSQG
jgi:transcriptional regulator with XRE-family HTH domain